VDGSERYYRKGIGWLLRFLLRPGLVNPARMLPVKRLADMRHMTRPVTGAPPVVVDNRALDGFIERFREKGCRDAECEACRWCHDFAAKAVRIDPEESRRALAAYDEVFRSLDGGSMWRYLPGGNGVGDP
jgi:hypothetical protein